MIVRDGSVRTSHSGPSWPGAFTQIGICQRPASRCAGSMKKRCWVSVTAVLPFAHDSETSTSGTPGWLTKVGRIRSTGLPDAADSAFEKSSDVAFLEACACRYAFTPLRNVSAPT